MNIESYNINVRGMHCRVEMHQLDSDSWEVVFPQIMKLSEIAEELQKKFEEEPEKFKTIKCFIQSKFVTVDRTDTKWLLNLLKQLEQ